MSLLSTDQVASLFREGFLCIPEFTSASDVAEMRSLLFALYDKFSTMPSNLAIDLSADASKSVPQINRVLDFEPKLKDTGYFQKASEIATQCLGPHTQLIDHHAIYKPPRASTELPWHQDQAYWEKGKLYHSLNFWLPLEDVSSDMGCMQFIPCSHWGDLLPHSPAAEGSLALKCTGDIRTEWAVACPIPAGGVTMHFPKTLHHTGPNNTDNPRHALILNFGMVKNKGEKDWSEKPETYDVTQKL